MKKGDNKDMISILNIEGYSPRREARHCNRPLEVT
jgi:hypothetical protein